MSNKAEIPQPASLEIGQLAHQRARERARTARWDLDVAVFLFAILIIVIILLFEGFSVEVVGPVAIFGLGMVWLVGYRREKQVYQRLYQEELAKLKPTPEKPIEETIEEKVQKALRERLG